VNGSNPITGPMPAGSVTLRGVAMDLASDVGVAFVADCCRHTEALLSDNDVKEKWNLSDKDWVALTTNGPLLAAVRNERFRRIQTGEAVREAAQRHLAKAPSVLGSILANEEISPRHRIEAARELRQTVGGEPENATPNEKFIIRINLGADYELHREFEILSANPTPAEDGETS
jgi:hypothetical protein